MLSWKLWRALNHPPALHPLFWRTLQRHQPSGPPTNLTSLDRMALAYLAGVAILFILTIIVDHSGTLTVLSIALGCLAIPTIVPVLILLRNTLLSGFYYGLLWADQMSRYLIRERQNNTYDLLSLLPPGALAPSWAICTGCLYQNRRFNRLIETHILTLRFIALGHIIINLFVVQSHLWPQQVLLLILVLSALHTDFMHSLVISILISLLATRYGTDVIDARLWTVGGYLCIQVGTYTLALLAALAVFPLPLPYEWEDTISRTVLGVLVMVGLREAIISVIWRWLLHEANTAPSDIESIFRFAA